MIWYFFPIRSLNGKRGKNYILEPFSTQSNIVIKKHKNDDAVKAQNQKDQKCKKYQKFLKVPKVSKSTLKRSS